MEGEKICIERLSELIGEDSLSEFCKKIGTSSKASVSAYLNGTRSPKLRFVKTVADYFGVSALWLMGEDVPKTENPTPVNEREVRFVKSFAGLSEAHQEQLLEYMAFLKSQESGPARQD